jgi:hypothetical protein
MANKIFLLPQKINQSMQLVTNEQTQLGAGTENIIL